MSPGRETEPFAQMIRALCDPARHAAGTARVDLRETHISCVLLAGQTAFKFKKPVDLGFLDFSTLEARRRCCEEELRLNRRTAPDLYLDVISITGSSAEPVLGGDGTPIEYAVRMRRFPEDALLDVMAREGRLSTDCIDTLAERLAAFHRRLEPAAADASYSSPAQVLAAALQNFAQIRETAGADAPDALLQALQRWTLEEHAALAQQFEARRREGFVRECHGDLHLGNIVMQGGIPTPFDGIEFNPALRWIDVMSEIAFLVMDLEEHGLAPLAFRFLNSYLEAGGDYAGLAVLRYYLVYRALVRAKVACIRAHQGAGAKVGQGIGREVLHYLAYARGVAGDRRGALILMHGLSGSGKTTIARRLCESLRAVHLRSDIERKRLHGLAPQARTAGEFATGIYSAGDTERTYARLAALARHAIAAGYPVIIDATFLAARHRAQFRVLARETGVPFAIMACEAPDAALRERVRNRAAGDMDASDAGPAVLEGQIAARDPLAEAESADRIVIDTCDLETALPAAEARLRAKAGL